MKPQATIEKTTSDEQAFFTVSKEEQGQTHTLEQQFERYQQALDYILEHGWQLKRESPAGSMHVETRFLKP